MSINDFTPRQLNASNFADRWQPRPDAHSKARGEQRYPTDELDWPGLLHGRILRSPYPHAQITGINVDAARKLPGVHAAQLVVPSTSWYLPAGHSVHAARPLSAL